MYLSSFSIGSHTCLRGRLGVRVEYDLSDTGDSRQGSSMSLNFKGLSLNIQAWPFPYKRHHPEQDPAAVGGTGLRAPGQSAGAKWDSEC